jgi:hypothetical protein
MSTELAKIVAASGPKVPEGWEAKAELIGQCIEGGKRLVVWIAILVAKAREDFATPEEWVSACVERWGWQKAHVHHLRQVGAFILANKSPVFHETLIRLEWMKLHALSRLPTNQVGPFLERVDVAGLNRDEVRDKVNAWIGGDQEGGKSGKAVARTGQAAAVAQPDFMRELFAVGQWRPETAARREMIASEKVRPVQVMMSGLSLLQVAVEKYTRARKVDVTEIEDAIDELDTQRALLIERLAGANGGTGGMLEG